MSWKASAWAKEQRLGSPAAKSILLCLADYADAERAECWPSQAQLAADAEVSERTAREWLQRLEDWGLLHRARRTRANGARASDMIVLNLDANVRDGVERCREIRAETGPDGPVLPAESAGRINRQPDADPTGNEQQPTGNQCRAYKEEPPIEPPSGTSHQAREGARESKKFEDRKKIEAAYWRMIRVWPKLNGLPKDTGLKAFMALSSEDRDTAARRFPNWLAALKAQGKDHVHQPSTYFAKRLFDDIPDPQDAPPEPVLAKPFGKPFGAFRMAKLLQGREMGASIPGLTATERRLVDEGAADESALWAEKVRRYGFPTVNRLHDAAAEGRSVTLSPEWREHGELTERVKVGSDLWCAWEAEHARRGWPWWPDPGKQDWVYFPAGGPVGLGAFEAAIRGNGNDGDRREAAE